MQHEQGGYQSGDSIFPHLDRGLGFYSAGGRGLAGGLRRRDEMDGDGVEWATRLEIGTEPSERLEPVFPGFFNYLASCQAALSPCITSRSLVEWWNAGVWYSDDGNVGGVCLI